MKSKGNSNASSSTNVQSKSSPGGGGGNIGRGNENKTQPTAEQIRYAKLSQMTGQEDHKIQEKIKLVAQITGKPLDVVAMALHELNYEEGTAIQKLIDGDYDTGVEWKTTASKKKKPAVIPTKTPNEPTPDTGLTVKEGNEETEEKPVSKPPGRGGRAPRRGRSRKPEEKSDDKLTENEDEKIRSLSERGRGRGKLQIRPQSRGRGRSAGYMSRGSFGRTTSRSRGRQPRRGRGRGGFGTVEQSELTQKNETESNAIDIAGQENWDDEEGEEDNAKSLDWAELNSSPEQSKVPMGDWDEQGSSQQQNLLYTSRNTSSVAADSWKQANGPQSGWGDTDSELRNEDSSYRPENVDDAVILSKRALQVSKSEATSYHSTSELSRTTYSSLENNQFPSSHPETSLTSGLPKQSYQIESLLAQTSGPSSSTKDFSTIPVISGIQDSRKLEQEQLQSQKPQRPQKTKRVTKPQPPCQPVEMPRSMMYDLDKQLSGLQFGSSPFGTNLSQESAHSVSAASTTSVYGPRSPATVTSAVTQDTPSPSKEIGLEKTANSQYIMEEFCRRYGDVVGAQKTIEQKTKEVSDLQEPKRQKQEALRGGTDLRSSLIRQEKSRNEISLVESPSPKSTVAESSGFNGVNDTREPSFSQSIDDNSPTRTTVQDIRRQNDSNRTNLQPESSHSAAISDLQKEASQKNESPAEHLRLTSSISRTSYIPDVGRQRKPQEATKSYPESVRHSVLGDQSRYVARGDVHKQSPPLVPQDQVRQSLRSDSARTSILPEMRHGLVQGPSRRSAPQEPSRNDGVAEAPAPTMVVAMPKSEKPKTPPGLSSLQERTSTNVYSASPSKDVNHLVNVTTTLNLPTTCQASLTNTFGSVSRGVNMAYASSTVPVASTTLVSTTISNLSQSAAISGTNTYSSAPLTTLGFTTGTSTHSTLKIQTTGGKTGPPGMLPLNLIHHNVQQGLVPPAFTHQPIAAASYHYDEMQMVQRMPMSQFYDPLMYTPATGSTRETLTNAHTFQGNEGKYGRENSSPVASSINQGTPHAHHPQPAIFAGAAVPYGFPAYYPHHGVIPGGFPVFTTAYQMAGPKVHMGNQYQSAYGGQPTQGYNSGGSQEFSKGSYHSSVAQSNPHKNNQGSVSLTSGTSATDSAHNTSGYKMQLNQDTKSFVNGTPPPLGIPVAHGQSHMGYNAPQYMMQHASMLPAQHLGHQQLESTIQTMHGGRPKQMLGTGSSQASKASSQSIWSS